MLRELLAKFDIKVDGLKDVADADRKVSTFEETIKRFAGALVSGALLAGFRAFTIDMAAMGDGLGKAANRMGVTTDQFQQIAHAAGLGGAKIEQIEPALVALQKNMFAAGNGAEGMTKIFDELGISTTNADGSLRNVADILPDLSAAFGGMDNDTRRLAMAATLMGEGGAKLLPMLKGDLPAAMAELKELGGGFSEDSVVAAENLTDAFARLDMSFTSIKAGIFGKLAPGYQWLIDNTRRTFVWLGKAIVQSSAVEAAMVLIGAAALVLAPKILAPFLPAILAGAKFALVIGTIFLVLEDLISWFQGKKSVFGAVIDAWFGKGSSDKARDFTKEVVGSLTWFWDEMLSGTSAADDNWSLFWTQIQADASYGIGAVLDLMPNFASLIQSAWAGLSSGVLAIAADMWEGVALLFADGIKTALRPVQGALDALDIDLDLLGKINEFAESASKGAGGLRGRVSGIRTEEASRIASLAESGALRASSLQQGSSFADFGPTVTVLPAGETSVSQSNVVNVRVDGAKDPAAVAREIASNAGASLGRFATQGLQAATTRRAR